jgi:hypothetical protein
VLAKKKSHIMTHNRLQKLKTIFPLLAMRTVAYLLSPAQQLLLSLFSTDSGLEFCPYKRNSSHSPKRNHEAALNQVSQMAKELNHHCQSIFQELLKMS